MTAMVSIKVWDWGVRSSHWLIVALVLLGWLTGEEEGLARTIHRYAGEALAGVLVFRLIWAFIGGQHARLASFLRGPGAVASHARDLIKGRPHQTLGHNPLGGWASIALWAAVAVTVMTGLMSLAEEGVSGPLATPLGVNLAQAHEVAFRLLQGLAAIHILGVAVTSFASKDNLLRAMITGSKRRPQTDVVSGARAATPGAGLAALAVAVVVSLGLMSLPHPSGRGHNEPEAFEQEHEVASRRGEREQYEDGEGDQE